MPANLKAQIGDTVRLSVGQEYITSVRDLITYYSIDPVVADAFINKDGFLSIKANQRGSTLVYYNDGTAEKSIEVQVIEMETPTYQAAGRIQLAYPPDRHRLSSSVNAIYNNNEFFYNRRYVHSAEFNFPVKRYGWLRSQVYVRQDPGLGAYVDTVHIGYEDPKFLGVVGDNSFTFGLYNTSIMAGIAFRGLTLAFFPQKTYDFADTTDSALYLFGGIKQPLAGESVIGTEDSPYGAGFSWQDTINKAFKYSVTLGHFNYRMGKKGHPLLFTSSQIFTPSDKLRIANTVVYNEGLGVFVDPAIYLDKLTIIPNYYYTEEGLGAPFTYSVEQNTKHRYGIQFREYLKDKKITLIQSFRQIYNLQNLARNIGSGLDNAAAVGTVVRFDDNRIFGFNYQFSKINQKDPAGGYRIDDMGHYFNANYHNKFNSVWSAYSDLNISKIFSNVGNSSATVDYTADVIARKGPYFFSANMDYRRRSSGRTLNIYSPGVRLGYKHKMIDLQYDLYGTLIQQSEMNQYYINTILSAVFTPTVAHQFNFTASSNVDMARPGRSLIGYFFIGYTLNFGHAIKSRPLVRDFFRLLMPNKVQGSVFLDENRNLKFDEFEKPIPGIQIASNEGETQSNKRGFYEMKFNKKSPSGEVMISPDVLPPELHFATENRRSFSFARKRHNYFDVPVWKETSQVDIYVYQDINGDGQYTYDVDIGIPSIPLIVYIGNNEYKKKTDNMGAVYLLDLENGTVQVMIDVANLPQGIEIVEGDTERTVEITEPSYQTIYFPVRPLRSVYGKIFFDNDKNGNFGEGDEPATGIKVSVGDSFAETDSQGNFSVAGVKPGSWKIKIAGPTRGRKPTAAIERVLDFGKLSSNIKMDIPLQ